VEWVAFILVLSLIVGLFFGVPLFMARQMRAVPPSKAMGGGLWYSEPIREGETVLGHVEVACRVATHLVVSGLLYLTDQRIVFAPGRSPLDRDGGAQPIEYEEIAQAKIEPRRQLGIGVVIPTPQEALVLVGPGGGEMLYWPGTYAAQLRTLIAASPLGKMVDANTSAT
jgi:hypothetical protein